jgi:hypothetical protein
MESKREIGDGLMLSLQSKYLENCLMNEHERLKVGPIIFNEITKAQQSLIEVAVFRQLRNVQRMYKLRRNRGAVGR